MGLSHCGLNREIGGDGAAAAWAHGASAVPAARELPTHAEFLAALRLRHGRRTAFWSRAEV